MADSRQKTTAATRLRLVLAFIGVTSLLVAGFALAALATSNAGIPKSFADLTALPFGQLLLGALGAAAICFGGLLLSVLGSMTGRRSASGLTGALGIILATFALISFNWFSLRQSRQFDLTRDQRFTLPAAAIEQLKSLDASSPVTVVLLQLHKSAGSLSNKADALDYAAERKVVEKVQDLVELFRRFGPQFNIVTLDTEDEEYGRKLDELTKGRPELLKAIESAPENSVLFADENQKVRRLGFNEFYRLDKLASRREVTLEDGKKIQQIHNLVLLPQGTEAFVKRAVADAKKPKVGLLTIHPELSSRETRDDYCAKGFRDCLEANGFEVIDVFTKDWSGRGGPKPAGYTYEEYELKRVEDRYNLYTAILQDRELTLRQLAEVKAKAEKATIADLNRMIRLPNGQKFTSEADKKSLLSGIDASTEAVKDEQQQLNKELAELGPKYRELSKDERAVESRRMADVKQKLTQILADCDILIVPRYTVMDISKGEVIRPSFYAASKEQAEVVREFMKTGKPVMALFGANNVGGGGGGLDGQEMPDDIERLFTQFGIEFGGQTIVYDAEAVAAAERSGGALAPAAKLPPLVFKANGNPVATAYLVSARGAGADFEFNRSGFRPITVKESLKAQLGYDPTVALTTSNAWNDEKPIPEDDYIPKFEPTKPDDPKKGTKDEEKRGPFSVGVAFESKLPAAWYTNTSTTAVDADLRAALAGQSFNGFEKLADSTIARPSIRVAALGHGGLFVGKTLDPATETLLLNTVNWQLRQDDRLPKDVPTGERWQFPRSILTESNAKLWSLIGFLGIPSVVAYLGVVVLLFRRLR